MVWRATEPQGTTEVPIGAGYVRDNWAYLETVLKKCLVFNSAAPAEDGNSNGVQFKVQTVDPAINLAGGGVFYGKTIDGVFAPYLRNSKGIFKVQVSVDAGTTNVLKNAETTVFNWAPGGVPYPRFCGYALAIDTASPDRTLLSPVYWDGVATVYHASTQSGQIASGSKLYKFTYSGALSKIRNDDSSTNISTYTRFFGVFT